MMKGSHPHRGAQRHQWRLSQTHETLSQLLQGCPRRASAPGARKDPAPWAHQGKSLGYCIGQDWEEGRIRSFVLCLCISVCFSWCYFQAVHTGMCVHSCAYSSMCSVSLLAGPEAVELPQLPLCGATAFGNLQYKSCGYFQTKPEIKHPWLLNELLNVRMK